MKLPGIKAAAVAGACVTATVVAGCSGSGGGAGGAGANATGGKLVDNATFTMAVASDPGNLDPYSVASSVAGQFATLAYDSLVNVTTKGDIVTGLASSWKLDGPRVTLTLRSGITCSDGSAFTAADAAANLNYAADPKNKSPFATYLPPGATATADASAGTVTLTGSTAAPFVLNGLANLPMVCAKGLKDRGSLAHATDGTGPYQLTQAAAGSQYTYTKRSGYTWGPDGATTAAKGMPAKVVVKVVANETTAANLLLTGGLNAATIVGADVARLQAKKLFSASTSLVLGELWFNHDAGRLTADKSVRMALAQALDLTAMQKAVTSGLGGPATTLAARSPAACPGNSIAAALPAHSLDAAKQLLDQDGWKVGDGGVRSKDGKPLSLSLIYLSDAGPGMASGAELAGQAWKELGVQVKVTAQDQATLSQNVFGAGNWDVGLIPINVSSPDQLVPLLSGAVPPNGQNFAHIDNAAYKAGVAKASAIAGAKGCPDWLAAEANLVRDADVIPFANSVTRIFGAKAQFDDLGTDVVPTSIRMFAG
jgi:peptide/nickel transport system substrate-binding protein